MNILKTIHCTLSVGGFYGIYIKSQFKFSSYDVDSTVQKTFVASNVSSVLAVLFR